jgi:hypothetical protein
MQISDLDLTRWKKRKVILKELRQTRSVWKALGMADQLSLFDQLDQED